MTTATDQDVTEGRSKPKDPGDVCPLPLGGTLAELARLLRQFDIIVFNTSGGKDSEAARLRFMRLVRELARLFGDAALPVIVFQHNDLGRVEWPGTRELAAAQVGRDGFPLVVRSRKGLDLLDDIASRKTREGRPRGFPTRNFRYCTSDHKTSVSRSLIVELARRFIREHGGIRKLGRHVRVLQIFGFRAEESEDRRKRAPFAFNPKASNHTTRDVYDWLPIHDWTERQVWEAIRQAGSPYHPIYDEAMPRLSCSFCVFGSLRSLGIAKRFRGDLATEYQRVEQVVGPFQEKRPLAVVPVAPGPRFAEYVVKWGQCPDCATPVLMHESETVRFCPAHAETGPWDQFTADQGAPPCRRAA